MTKFKHAGGRPTKYRPKFAQEILDFYSIEPYREVEVTHTNKKGETWSHFEERANDLPHLINFAKKIGVSYDSINEWEKKYPEFHQSLKQCKLMNEHMLMTNAMKALYNPSFAIFTAKNKFGWRDEQYLKGEGFNQVFNIIVSKDYKPRNPNNRLAGELTKNTENKAIC